MIQYFPTVEQVEALPESEQVRPFCSGTASMCWRARNCDECSKGVDDTQHDDDTYRRMVLRGEMCVIQYFVGLAVLTEHVPRLIAAMESTDPNEEWTAKCAGFKPRGGSSDAPRPLPVADNQLVLFVLDDLTVKEREKA